VAEGGRATKTWIVGSGRPPGGRPFGAPGGRRRRRL